MLCTLPGNLYSLFHLSLQHIVEVESLILQIRKLRQRDLILIIQSLRGSKWNRCNWCPDLSIFWIDLDLSGFSLPHCVWEPFGRRKSRRNVMGWSWVWSAEGQGGERVVSPDVIPYALGPRSPWCRSAQVQEDWVTCGKCCITLCLALSSPSVLGEESSMSQSSSTGPI